MTTVWRRPEWHEQAACRGKDISLFFPNKAGPGHLREALAVCDTCPVVTECADWAVTRNELYGVWGGRSCRQIAQQRRTFTRRISDTCVICGSEYTPYKSNQVTCSTECAGKNQHRTQREQRAERRNAA